MEIFSNLFQRSKGYCLSIYLACFFLLFMSYAQLNAKVLKAGVGDNHKVLEQIDTLKKTPNFIIIFCDNLGYGDIEPFGSKVIRTPELNRMAKEGRKFTHFLVTAGVCTPSRASIMTGCYSQRVGMHVNPRDGLVLRPISPYGLNPEEVTIAEVLKSVGYKTGLIGKWHLGDQPEFLPNNQGFDYFYGIPYSDDMTQEVGQRIGTKFNGSNWPPLPVMENSKVVQAGVDRNLLTKDYTEKALEFIDQNQNTPFFLYLPQAMPGSTTKPFASEAFKGKSKGGPWGDSVEELDWSVGQIMNKLEQLGIDENTIVVFTSDNGAPMTDDPESTVRGTNFPLSGRGYTTAEGAFRVPTIFWWPGTVPAGSVSEEMATTMDFLPTFALLSGAKVPQDRIIDGKNILPLILGEKDAKTPHDVFYYYYMDQLQAIRSGQWKLFLPLKEFKVHPYFKEGEENQPLLFNVVNDVTSSHNLAAEKPEIVKSLTELAAIAKNDLGNSGQPGLNQRSPGKMDHPVPVLMK
ncbi:sulfatase family protein [Cyclobacterium amurskyense]|uniref:Arylsulfatase A n=1 Tax=Cyclobacterium amurskyense TaxID=320787 RepID=A0A0H4PNJ5_9BACT|nr:sulfatase [Cyclobacterium amurskyense]AKP49822.1 Arylsulfatase A [Cyclobacterium amurskyense]